MSLTLQRSHWVSFSGAVCSISGQNIFIFKKSRSDYDLLPTDNKNTQTEQVVRSRSEASVTNCFIGILYIFSFFQLQTRCYRISRNMSLTYELACVCFVYQRVSSSVLKNRVRCGVARRSYRFACAWAHSCVNVLILSVKTILQLSLISFSLSK